MKTVDLKEHLQVETGIIPIGELELESGKRLPDVTIAYERVGNQQAPAILVCHALTGNQHAVGSPEQPGWWSGLIGSNRYIDTTKFQVITTNILGGCNGTSGPLSIHPSTGQPYGSSFPFVTVRDMVHAQCLALKKIGINHLRAVIGGSLGGMQVLEWGILYPTFIDVLFPLAVTPYLSDYAIAFNAMGRMAITQDPDWKHGNYDAARPPKNGLSLARMIGMVTYRTGELFNHRFSRSASAKWGEEHQELTFHIESYLSHQGEKLVQRFDANSYLYLLKAMDSHDIGRNRGGWQHALQQIKAPIIALSFQGDLLYPGQQLKIVTDTYRAYGRKAKFFEVNTIFGHDGFLVEFEKWGHYIQAEIDL